MRSSRSACALLVASVLPPTDISNITLFEAPSRFLQAYHNLTDHDGLVVSLNSGNGGWNGCGPD